MKRDMDLIREILIAIVQNPNTQRLIELVFPGHDDVVVSYQVKLLADARLIEATNLSHSNGFAWMPRSLTWEGHEFLDSARNESVWNKAMAKLKDQAASGPFQVLKAVVIKTCKETFGVG